MTQAEFREMIGKAIAEKDSDALDLVAAMCAQSEEAKRIPREKGYGVTGTPIVDTARMVQPAYVWQA